MAFLPALANSLPLHKSENIYKVLYPNYDPASESSTIARTLGDLQDMRFNNGQLNPQKLPL